MKLITLGNISKSQFIDVVLFVELSKFNNGSQYQKELRLIMSKIHVGFWTNNSMKDQKFKEWFLNQEKNSGSDFVKKIMFDVMNKKLIVPTDKDLKMEKIRVDIEFKKIMILIKRKELLHWQTFNKSPSYQGLKAIKVGVDHQQSVSDSPSCYDEKNHRFQCPECGVLFVFAVDENDINESKELFIDHYFQKHGEIPKKLERELIEH